MEKRISLDNAHGQLTLAKCRNSCYQAAYDYVGVKDDKECWCSPYIAGEWTKDPKDCNSTCSGDVSTMCGGKSCMNVF